MSSPRPPSRSRPPTRSPRTPKTTTSSDPPRDRGARLTAALAADPFAPIAPFYDRLMAAVPYDQWVDYTLTLFRRHAGQGTLAVDLATGTGAVALRLAAQNFRVLGLDRSLPMLQQAAGKRPPPGARVAWACQDIRRLGLAPQFDLAVCLYDSLNYLASPRDFTRALAAIAGVLRPGGVLVFDLNSVHALEARLFDQEDLDPKAPVRYQWRSDYDPKKRLATIEMRFWPHDSEEVSVLHLQRAYRIEEVTAALKTARLSCRGIYDGAGLAPPDARTERLFFVAQKP